MVSIRPIYGFTGSTIVAYHLFRVRSRVVLRRESKVQTRRQGLSTEINLPLPIFPRFPSIHRFRSSLSLRRFPNSNVASVAMPSPGRQLYPLTIPYPCSALLYTLTLDYRLNFWTTSDTHTCPLYYVPIEQPRHCSPAITHPA